MKYLKKFENKKLNLHVGDYILVKTDDDRINNEVMIVTKIPNNNYFFKAELPDYFSEYNIYYSDKIKKLTPEEVFFYKDINKYNL